jgi:hypothetical protein
MCARDHFLPYSHKPNRGDRLLAVVKLYISALLGGRASLLNGTIRSDNSDSRAWLIRGGLIYRLSKVKLSAQFRHSYTSLQSDQYCYQECVCQRMRVLSHRAFLVCMPYPVPSVRSESGYFRSLERRCGDGTEGEVDRVEHRLFCVKPRCGIRRARRRARSAEVRGSRSRLTKWRGEYGGLKIDQAKRLKEFERENERLKEGGSELTLDKLSPATKC